MFHLGILLWWVQSPNRNWCGGERLGVGYSVLGPGMYPEKACGIWAANGRETNTGISGIGFTSNASISMCAVTN